MNRTYAAQRALTFALILAAALVSMSCESSSGMGVGVGYPTRWGGGSSGPPIFVGGPAF